MYSGTIILVLWVLFPIYAFWLVFESTKVSSKERSTLPVLSRWSKVSKLEGTDLILDGNSVSAIGPTSEHQRLGP